ncbi:hypothetical protein CONCODRAFT_77233 [Conidiobolus coronatus NRRL 28638]|uniref:Uncharacterized protein n=1 Tax=Conidiobolus coronatus (strain ATCC 28846 / CBS 209.66 / NRRL 28638) TaxID=796925 RepID=A0A137PF75_CONC2|nr:hypothetical protein CONCODRAFT_77233 [Conidiobolus coronatus NRRL 28638]|eukprot:KXN73647.1 hypothetical protein CONCODRAFT_77233 [Conidiobolus coronatus NRRL 28638]
MGINKSSQKLITIGLYLSELRSFRTQSILKNTCADLNLRGFYKPGKPGKVIIQSEDPNNISQFLFIVKSLNIKQCSLNTISEVDMDSIEDINLTSSSVPSLIQGFSKCDSDIHLQEVLNSNNLGGLYNELSLKRVQNFPTWEMLEQDGEVDNLDKSANPQQTINE